MPTELSTAHRRRLQVARAASVGNGLDQDAQAWLGDTAADASEP